MRITALLCDMRILCFVLILGALADEWTDEIMDDQLADRPLRRLHDSYGSVHITPAPCIQQHEDETNEFILAVGAFLLLVGAVVSCQLGNTAKTPPYMPMRTEEVQQLQRELERLRTKLRSQQLAF